MPFFHSPGLIVRLIYRCRKNSISTGQAVSAFFGPIVDDVVAP